MASDSVICCTPGQFVDNQSRHMDRLLGELQRCSGWNNRAQPLIWTSVLRETISAVGDFAAFQVAIRNNEPSTTANSRPKRREKRRR